MKSKLRDKVKRQLDEFMAIEELEALRTIKLRGQDDRRSDSVHVLTSCQRETYSCICMSSLNKKKCVFSAKTDHWQLFLIVVSRFFL